jgi:hypothetical protein
MIPGSLNTMLPVVLEMALFRNTELIFIQPPLEPVPHAARKVPRF